MTTTPGPHWYDVLDVWRSWADDLRGQALACGHYLPEEAPEETLVALQHFLGADHARA